ncbi:Hypothetical predicted protein [Paramuricea clavata]|uniref:Uncharacterized protein n=1 Tax=Paramuricea clavata TaxID=317549 RepID=A0A6S7JV16_PARCT|nr:Hypothetical predicted protein [Paramuricea clavata]
MSPYGSHVQLCQRTGYPAYVRKWKTAMQEAYKLVSKSAQLQNQLSKPQRRERSKATNEFDQQSFLQVIATEHSGTSEDTERNPVTPSETSEQEDGNPIMKNKISQQRVCTTVEITTENPITQTQSTTNEHENVIKAGNNGEETARFYPQPQRARQPPSRFGYNTRGNPATGVFNVWQNPIVGMMQTYDFPPPQPHLFYGYPPTPPPAH